jgi:hypothetical protein
MDRPLPQSSVSSPLQMGNIAFAVATSADGEDIRRLLREGATDGWIRISLEREPDAFATTQFASRHAFIIARKQQSREAIGICEQSLRHAFIDGKLQLLPYLGALRVTPKYRHQIGVLKGGFMAVRKFLQDPTAVPYALTAIAADNHVALRLLGAGLPGMPTYRPLEPISTFALRPSRRRKEGINCEFAAKSDLPAIAVHLQRCYQKRQFAPEWTAVNIALCRDLYADDFIVIRRGPGIAACVALWDQQHFKQTIVRGYSDLVGRMRPAANFVAPLLRMPRLPAPGEPLSQIFLSHLAVDDDNPHLFTALIDAALTAAYERKFAVALLGLACRHPLADITASRYRPREYRSLLHLVHWDDGRGAAETVWPLIPHVEIAML